MADVGARGWGGSCRSPRVGWQLEEPEGGVADVGARGWGGR